MAKTIKFNLKCDGSSIRTLDDLREHFCVQDVLGYYKSGILARWLKVQDYIDEFDKVNTINADTEEKILIQLVDILGVDLDNNSIRDAVSILDYERKNGKFYESYAKGIENESKVINDYLLNYNDLVKEIIKNKEDFSVIKATLATLVKNYKGILKMDFRNLFYKMHSSAPLALIAFVVTKELQKNILPEWITTEDGNEIWDVEEKKVEDPLHARHLREKREMYDMLCDLVAGEKEMRTLLGDKLKCNSQNTEGHWVEIESDERKRYLIFSMQQGCKVRSLKNKDEVFRANDINRLFVVLNGIEYSNGYNYKLFYMEV